MEHTTLFICIGEFSFCGDLKIKGGEGGQFPFSNFPKK